MKRIFLPFIFMFFSLLTFGQWIENHNIEQKCAHIPVDRGEMAFDQLYYWQSEYLEDYDVKFYFLDIEVSSTSTFVGGNVAINATTLVNMDTLAFELIDDMDIQNIFVDGTDYQSFSRIGDNVLVPITEIPANTDFTVKILYSGEPASGGFFSGITNDYSNQWSQSVTWTLSEPFAAKDWFPVKQDLEDKADSVWVFLTTASTNIAGSQGLLTDVVDLGNGKTRYEWKSSYPIDYYLISFAVADYQEYNIYAYPEEMQGDSILIQNFIYNSPGALDYYKNGIDNTSEMIDLFSDLYILYPFHKEKYGHCLTQLGGGMEHQTMTTMGGFGFGLVAHELGHMWFGDNVTCATWSDIWINEGFATYSNYLAEEFLHGWESGQGFIIGKQNSAMSANGGSVYIPENEILPGAEWRIFDGRLSYNKGAAIIHILRHEINDDVVFFDVLETFQTQYTSSTATGENFKAVAEEVASMDFEAFFDQWYYGQGFPIYDLKWYMTDDNVFHLTSTQTTSSSATTLFTNYVDYQLKLQNGSDTIVRLMQTDNLSYFEVQLDQPVVGVTVDPNNWTMEEVNSISVNIENPELPVYFSMGPNPVKNDLNIYFLNPTNENRQINISDVSGKIFYSESSFADQIRIDLANLSSGIYFVSVSDSQNKLVRKIIK